MFFKHINIIYFIKLYYYNKQFYIFIFAIKTNNKLKKNLLLILLY